MCYRYLQVIIVNNLITMINYKILIYLRGHVDIDIGTGYNNEISLTYFFRKRKIPNTSLCIINWVTRTHILILNERKVTFIRHIKLYFRCSLIYKELTAVQCCMVRLQEVVNTKSETLICACEEANAKPKASMNTLKYISGK